MSYTDLRSFLYKIFRILDYELDILAVPYDRQRSSTDTATNVNHNNIRWESCPIEVCRFRLDAKSNGGARLTDCVVSANTVTECDHEQDLRRRSLRVAPLWAKERTSGR